MIIPDANLILYAYDTTNPFHDAARLWWEARLSGSEAIGLTHPVIFAFVRIGTSARAFESPMSLREASGHVTSWLDRRVARILQPATDHVLQVLRLLAAAGSAGANLVTDAQIAAMAMAHGATVHTADRDFMRFPDLRYHFPLA